MRDHYRKKERNRKVVSPENDQKEKKSQSENEITTTPTTKVSQHQKKK